MGERRRRGLPGVRTGCVLVVLWLATAASGVQATELILPENVFYYHPVATVFGENAVWVNPAALGSRQSGSVFLFTQRENRFIRDWGGAAGIQMFGIAYRHIDNGELPDHDEYAVGMGGGRMTKIGFSYRYIKHGAGYLNRRHLWNVAVMLQRNENVSLGARIENLNRGKIDGRRSDMRFVYGIGARVYRDLVTVSFEVDMTQKENLNAADFRTGIEARPLPGLYLYADFDNHSRFNLGIRANIESEYIGHYHNFDRDIKSRMGTWYVGSVRGKQPSLVSPRRKTLMVRLDGSLPENPRIPLFRTRPLRYFDYVNGIYRAADDDEIGRLFLHIGTLGCGIGQVEELTDAVRFFRSRGKPVYAFIDQPNNLGYLLGSAADTVIIPPVSQVNLIGLRLRLLSLKGMMEKVGVEAEIERVGEYKTAPEQYMFDRPTESNREQADRILDNIYREFVRAIAVNRHLAADSVSGLIDMAPLTSVEARELGLVDDLRYYDDALGEYGGSGGVTWQGKITLGAYAMQRDCLDRWGPPKRLALVIADGDITPGRSGGRVGDYEMLAAIKRAREDKSVRGVLLRVNSPGGDALASDLIRHEIDKTAQQKPVVISMGNVAASGGYYISSVDGEIFVNRSTITGSIGVYGGKANVGELLDKVGIFTETRTRGRNAGMYSLVEPYSDQQRELLRRHLREFYEYFTGIVAEARSMSSDSVDALGRGRVWTGMEAIDNGLADRVGGVLGALAALRAECRLPRDGVEIILLPEERMLFTDLLPVPEFWRKISGWIGRGEEALSALRIPQSGQIFYRLPYDILIE